MDSSDVNREKSPETNLEQLILGEDDLKYLNHQNEEKMEKEPHKTSSESVAEQQCPELWQSRGFLFIQGTHLPHEVEQIKHVEIRDSDVFVITFPKSGTIWMQQIMLLIQSKGDVESISKNDKCSNGDVMPWIELNGQLQNFVNAESPRLRVSHMPCHLMPTALKHKRGKVIYVARNPKDVLVSYYHFHKMATMLETPKSFDDFFDKFLNGKVMGGSWFEHVKSWYSLKDDLNMFFITYEEMIKDLSSAVRRMADFLEAELTPEQLQNVVKHSTFKNMRRMPQASYKQVPGDLLDQHKGSFMRKGTVGDWKNHFTVAQNERFDEVFEREMKDFPLSFTWDKEDIS